MDTALQSGKPRRAASLRRAEKAFQGQHLQQQHNGHWPRRVQWSGCQGDTNIDTQRRGPRCPVRIGHPAWPATLLMRSDWTRMMNPAPHPVLHSCDCLLEPFSPYGGTPEAVLEPATISVDPGVLRVGSPCHFIHPVGLKSIRKGRLPPHSCPDASL